MAGVTFSKTSGNIVANLEGKLKRARTVQSYLNTAVVRQYQTAQIERWQTEGASEGVRWPDLNPRYAEWKAKKFASSPGGGRAMMIRTGALSDAAMLRDGGAASYKLVSNTSIRIGVNDSNLPYAKWAAEKRSFMEFSAETIAEMRQGISDFIGKGIQWRAG